MAARRRTGPRYRHADEGGRIRERRNELGLTASEVAKAAELTEGHLGVIERGGVRSRDRKLRRLCNVLGLRVEYVRTGKGRRLLRDSEQNSGLE